MAKATDKQKQKMDELGIYYSSETTSEEAREAIMDQLDLVDYTVKRKNVKDLKNDALLENSDWED